MAGHSECPECQSSYAARLLRSEVEKEEHNCQKAIAKGDEGSKDGRLSPVMVFNPYYTGRPRSPTSGVKNGGIDRQEIIRQIKSGERPGSRPTSPELERSFSPISRKRKSPEPKQTAVDSTESSRPSSRGHLQESQLAGLQIERPRSALHRGDFREKDDTSSKLPRFGHPEHDEPTTQLSTSPVAPWHADFPTAAFRRALNERRAAASTRPVPLPARPVRSRAVSNASFQTSVLYQPPTSPLVQSSRPDTPEPRARSRTPSPDKSRRHTFSPQSMQRFSSALNYAAAHTPSPRQPPGLRKESTYPYQAHQPRRSLNSFSSPPRPPPLGSRRPSVSETPLHHAPMVGSYEESILRGRMSTTPSKPLNFVAQIGVLGKGNCPSNLQCPPHAIIPFPAVFYSYSPATRSAGSAQPSPYVGLVDLEHNLPVADSAPEKRRHRVEAAISDEGIPADSHIREDRPEIDAQVRRRKTKQKRRSGSPKAPPGGSYRIPQQGQLQIVIKNPNKTAVKLFLVPYDLTDMEPGQKTFIRQRSYSAGPIIDMPLSSRKNLGTDRPEASLSTSEDPHDRPMLRYLIHLHICCPSKGRFFLYKSIRVVFANRVPDGKEKLRYEIQLPEPRYSVYKAGRDSNVGLATKSTEPSLSSTPTTTTPPPVSAWMEQTRFAHSLPSMDYDRGYDTPMPPLPSQYSNPLLPGADSRGPNGVYSDDSASPIGQRSPELGSALSPISSNSSGERQWGSLAPRLDTAFVFQRDHSRERTSNGRSESLLSRRLRDLAMQPQSKAAELPGQPSADH